jgi:hypothetical protein
MQSQRHLYQNRASEGIQFERNNEAPYEDGSMDLSQFRPGSSGDDEVSAIRSDIQDVKICDVNSNSDISLQGNRQLNT